MTIRKLLLAATATAAAIMAFSTPGCSKKIMMAQGPAPADFTDGATGIEMVFVKDGTFRMGSAYEQKNYYEFPAHNVTVGDFHIGRHEVTQKQWALVMGSDSSQGEKGDSLPVNSVSWDDAQEFVRRLNAMTGRAYRLPSEAEWEYAARGGSKSNGYKFSGSNNLDEVAWHDKNSGKKAHSVGTKAPNELGIYDMSGNLWEWVNEWYYSMDMSFGPNQTPPSGYAQRMIRGGTWNDGLLGGRAEKDYYVSNTSGFPPDARSIDCGFRIALSAPETPAPPAAGGQTHTRQTPDTDRTPAPLIDTRDGKNYRTVRIGNMLWMAENLNYKTGISRCYDDDSSNCVKYGRLYDWNTAKSACPDGWRLPRNENWADLAHIMGGSEYSADLDGEEFPVWDSSGIKFKAKNGWDWGDGTDDYGFAALPGGGYDDGFRFAGSHGLWWTATENGDSEAYLRSAAYNHGYIYEHRIHKSILGSVRCAVEITTAEEIEKMSSYFTDSRDGKKYRAVKIGGMTWMAQNLNYQTGHSCCYRENISYCDKDKHGRMYDWNTATKACPAGWHLPTRQEWGALTAAVGFETSAEKLKAASGWARSYGNGSDEYGFSALPGGTYDHGCFPRSPYQYGNGNEGAWWTATELDGSNYAYGRRMNYHNFAYENCIRKSYKRYVRCVMDAE
jgi:uncharacterized protein (TIGR02145 family)